MSQSEIGNLFVRMGIDSAEFAAGVRRVQGSLGTLTGALKGFAAAFSASMVFDAAVGALKAVAEIGDVAESIGVSAEQLQVFNKMALASGTSTDVLTRGLQSIAEQSVDASSKLGQLFEANGLTMKGKETNQIIREFMDLVKNAASPTEQLAIITGVLGDKVGRQLVEAFREGAAGADEATKSMIASGEYHTNAEVKRLQELETKYNQTVDRIATYWQKAIVGIVSAADKIEFRYIPGQGGARSAVANRPVPTKAQFPTGGPMGGAGQFNFPAVNPTVMPPPPPPPGSSKPSSTKNQSIVPKIEPGTIEDIYGAGEAVNALELAFQGATPEAGLFSDTLLSLGDNIAMGLSDALTGLITGTMSVQDAFKSMAQSIVQTLTDLAAQLAVNAGLKILIAALGGGGGAGFNIGGMAFGGIYGDGGYLGAGQWGIAGERGPEIIHGPARITPMDKMGGGGQMNVTVNNYAGAQVQTRQTPNGVELDIMEARLADRISRGGNLIDSAIQRGYGLRRSGR